MSESKLDDFAEKMSAVMHLVATMNADEIAALLERSSSYNLLVLLDKETKEKYGKHKK